MARQMQSRTRKPTCALLCSLLLLALACAALAQSEAQIALTIKGHRIQAALTRNDVERKHGLMFRTYLAPDAGMLFIYEAEQAACMWMKNTVLPLSVAFINRAGSILNIIDMQPLELASHCASGKALYALEMNQGWFEMHGIAVGDTVEGLVKPGSAAAN